MKVYVDKLPKKCKGCRFCTSDYYCDLISRNIFDYDKSINNQTRYYKCPLQTLADHDKQVRKQVCDEIRNRSAKSYSGYALNLGKGVYSYTVCDFVLEQIEKGEINENNKETNI